MHEDGFGRGPDGDTRRHIAMRGKRVRNLTLLADQHDAQVRISGQGRKCARDHFPRREVPAHRVHSDCDGHKG